MIVNSRGDCDVVEFSTDRVLDGDNTMRRFTIQRLRHQLARSLGPITALLALLLSPWASTATAAAGYSAQGGKLYDPAGQELRVRGISHFGFSSEILQPQFLWSMGWKEQIAQIKSLGFNAVRLPFVPDALYVTTPVNQLSYVDPNKNPELIGKTPLQVLDLWMAEANRQGLYVMLDFHSVSRYRLYPTWFIDNPNDYWLTYNGQAYSADHWVRDLKFVAARYAHLQNFFAIDLYNEPHGQVRWSTGDPQVTNSKFYWKPAAEKAAAAVLQSNPRLLIFVQGINGNYDGIEDSSLSMNWGESFQQQAYQPLNIAADKLVLSPHTYGPDVYVKSSFSAPDFPNNLPAQWDKLFGQFAGVHPIVVGEWGGRFGDGGVGEQDVIWQNALVDYLLSKNIRSSFYWCYTPNSTDTGGILDDDLRVREDKIALLQRHWETRAVTPSTLTLSTANLTVAQTAGSLTISVARSGGVDGDISVRYTTVDGTARAGTDYTARSGMLSWSAGDSSARSISVPISNALPFIGSRSFGLRLLNASNAVILGTPSSTNISITGSAVAATPATLALSAASYTVSQAAGTVTLTVRRSASSTAAVSLRYATVNGSATSGRDFRAASGTLSWAKGDMSDKRITLTIVKQKPFSGSRSFSLKLSSPSIGANLGTPSAATVTMLGTK